jgi:predicted amidohydrolase
MTVFKAACVQMRSSRDVEENVRIASELIREARSAGADFIATPENTTIMDEDRERLRTRLYPDTGDNPTLRAFQELTEKVGCWVLIGGMPVLSDDGRFSNRSVLIKPDGGVAARYDKIHMFDVKVSESEQYQESKNFKPGSKGVIADLPWGKVGMTVCYDLRFAYLYRALAKAGASFLTVPSAFTKVTGQAHWHVLLRARAIETGCFVIAPAQGGTHENGRETYGHSLIVDPWGRVLGEAGEEPCVVIAKIDPDDVGKAHARIPALDHTVDLPAIGS